MHQNSVTKCRKTVGKSENLYKWQKLSQSVTEWQATTWEAAIAYWQNVHIKKGNYKSWQDLETSITQKGNMSFAEGKTLQKHYFRREGCQSAVRSTSTLSLKSQVTAHLAKS